MGAPRPRRHNRRERQVNQRRRSKAPPRRFRPDQPARLSVALVSPAAANVSGQIFGASGEDIILYSQPRPVETVTKEEGWTVQSILSEAIPKMEPKFTPLSRPPLASQGGDAAPAKAG